MSDQELLDSLMVDLRIRVAVGATYDDDYEIIYMVQDPKFLTHLAGVHDGKIRLAVAINPNTDDETLLLLYQNEENSLTVRHTAWDMLRRRNSIPLFEYRHPAPQLSVIDPYNISIPPPPPSSSIPPAPLPSDE